MDRTIPNTERPENFTTYFISVLQDLQDRQRRGEIK